MIAAIWPLPRRASCDGISRFSKRLPGGATKVTNDDWYWCSIRLDWKSGFGFLENYLLTTGHGSVCMGTANREWSILGDSGVCKPSQIRKYLRIYIWNLRIWSERTLKKKQNCGYYRANSSANVRISIANLRFVFGSAHPWDLEGSKACTPPFLPSIYVFHDCQNPLITVFHMHRAYSSFFKSYICHW